MNNCKTCKFWQPPSEEEMGGGEYESVLFPEELDYWDGPDKSNKDREVRAVELTGFAVRFCKHPKMYFYRRPLRDGVAVVDGSEWSASMLTGEDFGCVLHEAGEIR